MIVSSDAVDGVLTCNTRAVVKWFNENKGFGFVTPAGTSKDAFVHITVLEEAGLKSLQEGATVVCDVADEDKGMRVAAIHGVDNETALEETDGVIIGRVKFFRTDKGFGFVCPEDGSRDIFVHARALEKSGLFELETDQRVRMTIRQGQKGPMAETIEVV